MNLDIFKALFRKQRPYDLSGKLEFIESEFSRARRYKYPISLIVIDYSSQSPSRALNNNGARNLRNYSAIQKYNINKYTKDIKNTIREFDQVVEIDDLKQIIIICPETDETQASKLANRLLKTPLPQSILNNINIVSFPKDGPTFRAVLSSVKDKKKKPDKKLHQ